MQVCNYAHIYKYASIPVYTFMQVCKYAHMQVCTYIQVCKYILVCKCATMPKYEDKLSQRGRRGLCSCNCVCALMVIILLCETDLQV